MGKLTGKTAEVVELTRKIIRLCQIPTCDNEATCGRFCKEHYSPIKAKTNRKQTNSNRAGYTYKWQQARKIYLMMHPLCVKCGEPATDVDHIIPHKGNMALFWNRENWQPLCHRCHSIKTATEDGGWGRTPKNAEKRAENETSAHTPPGGIFLV